MKKLQWIIILKMIITTSWTLAWLDFIWFQKSDPSSNDRILKTSHEKGLSGSWFVYYLWKLSQLWKKSFRLDPLLLRRHLCSWFQKSDPVPKIWSCFMVAAFTVICKQWSTIISTHPASIKFNQYWSTLTSNKRFRW